MKALFNAVFSHYNASGASELLTKMYNTEADSDAEFPYVVMQMVVGSPDDFASGQHFTEDWLIQFNLFDDAADMSALLEAYAAVTAAFDFAALTIAGYTFLSCVRPPGSTLQGKDDGVWRITVQYRIKARVV